MKKRQSLYVVLALLAMGITGWYYGSSLKSHARQASIKSIAHPVRVVGNTNKTASDALNVPLTPSQIRDGQAINAVLYLNPTAVIPMRELVAAGVSTSQIKQGVLDGQNAQPIEFYGKVMDQYGSPVSGAKIRGNVLLNAGLEGSASKDYYSETDSNGFFNFTGLHGAQFWVTPSKPGYEYNPLASVNWRNDYKSDPKNPILFTMWKQAGAEPMVHHDFHFLIPCDGTPINVSLMSGKAVATAGDMVISFSRNPVQINRAIPFEWSFTLEVPGGGLIEARDLYPYEAPENGYQETITVGTGPNPKNFANSLEKIYYFKASAEKYYGRMTLKLQTNFQPPPTFLQIDVYVNPSGSRNLEFDGAKVVKSP